MVIMMIIIDRINLKEQRQWMNVLINQCCIVANNFIIITFSIIQSTNNGDEKNPRYKEIDKLK